MLFRSLQLVPFHHIPRNVSLTVNGNTVAGKLVGLDTTNTVNPDKLLEKVVGLISKLLLLADAYNNAPRPF